MRPFPRLLLLSLAALPGSAPAQSVLYQTAFDDAAGWSGLASGAFCGWKVDAAPVPPQGQGAFHSAPTSLNCNQDLGGYATCFKAVADSPPVDLSPGLGSGAELSFWCTYDLEEGQDCTYDTRHLKVSSDGFQTVLLDVCYTVFDCTPGAWHLHQVELDPAWGTVQVRFFFDVFDGLFCNECYEGWFVDDLVVTEGCSSVAYCTAGTSASGCSAAIGAAGTPSASAPSGFVLRADGVEGSKRGLFFFGLNGRQAAPWGNGTSYQCVVPPVARGPLLDETGTQGLCDGAPSFDLNGYWSAKPWLAPGAGALVQAQFWFRDPQSTTNVKTSLSDALEFSVCP